MSARSYCVGLPVVIDVHEDGTVTFTPDLSEATDDLWESHDTEAGYTDAQIENDTKLIDDAVDLHYGNLSYHIVDEAGDVWVWRPEAGWDPRRIGGIDHDEAQTPRPWVGLHDFPRSVISDGPIL